ncbi:PIG-L family deacetylase [Niastella sp. OAS944]|uniref:PIG-L family deacetylase n=1 Tax=Niastella sp. OAS944 TaxID=2664089 RepID=UPI00348E2790|nr:hypothetical protein [Chitinophagaceae bacterium OAS944]
MQSFKRIAFYFIAHADDWQLFMAPEISKSIADKECKVVIVHTTAGDAGKDEKYWSAREIASIESLLFRVSVDPVLQHEERTIRIGNKSIASFKANNCVLYFLRLPDGNYDGTGFSTYLHQSLDKFRTGQIPTIASVDERSVYTNWEDLTMALDNIIFSELSDSHNVSNSEIQLNIPEPDVNLNQHTHNDHYNTALLVQSSKAYQQYPVKMFRDYCTINSNDLLSGDELFWKIGMFCIYHHSVYKQYGHSTIEEDRSFIPWCFRNSSFRTK